MKKVIWMTLFIVTFCALSIEPASALTNGVVKVGLRYGSSAMASANLENEVGSGYEFGYYDDSRQFVALARTAETKITMTPVASGISVSRTGSSSALFQFDTTGGRPLGVRPIGDQTETWFRGYKYAGGFEYVRASAGSLNVINVVDLEDYVKGVVPYEMPGQWPLAALEAQAVCARTFALGHSKHLKSSGFDVCSTIDCQVYNGRGTGSSTGAGPTASSDQAAENTAGQCLYYQGALVKDAVYHSSDGGATEDAAFVWGTNTGYLRGKLDPYEKQTSVPNNSYTVTYSAAELGWILDQKGYSVGTVQDAYVSEYTPMGNVSKVTFKGSSGTKTIKGETCRTVFSSSTYKKSVNSQRFDINGGGRGTTASPLPDSPGGTVTPTLPASPNTTPGSLNTTSGALTSLNGAAILTSGGQEVLWGDTASVMTGDGLTDVASDASGFSSSLLLNSSGNFVITGTGNGHNVGMSQYGAKAMAELGYDYRSILEFYYTGITIG